MPSWFDVVNWFSLEYKKDSNAFFSVKQVCKAFNLGYETQSSDYQLIYRKVIKAYQVGFLDNKLFRDEDTDRPCIKFRFKDD